MSRISRACMLAVALLTTAPTLFAIPCEGEFSDVRRALNEAPIGQGSRDKILMKVTNAWSQYARGKNQWDKNAQKQLQDAIQLLSGPQTKTIPAATITKLRDRITALSTCLTGAPTVILSSVQVKVFLYDDETAVKTPAGAGAVVLFDGVEEGTTGSDGTLTVKAAEGQHAVAAQQYGSRSGAAAVTVVAGVPTSVEVLLRSSAAVYLGSNLYADEIADGVLPSTFTTLTLRLIDDDEKQIRLKRIVDVRLIAGQATSDSLASLFVAQTDGRITTTNASAIKTWLDDHFGPYAVELTAIDDASRSYNARLGFEVGRYRATASLHAPSSAPALPVGGLNTTLTHASTRLVFSSVTDATGALTLPLLPEGFYLIQAETLYNGNLYLARGAVFLNGDRTVTITLFKPGQGGAQ